MKKIAVTIIAITFIFTLASLSFAAYEFQMQGIVTKINGNQITIKDDKGKETTVEGQGNGIKVGDTVLVTGTIKLRNHQRDKLTAEDIDFLTKQCLIDRTDIEIIPQMNQEAQNRIASWITSKDCNKLTPFKATRNYYRQLQYNKPIPLPPAGWSIIYLTDKEFERYVDILDKTPW